mmetsp:Transcript_6039/g.9620  ORF Transcript_6039/g.9620 Transcript_6039/m.9620 type:complete len:240 (+) Transcript_6039:87-806(+)
MGGVLSAGAVAFGGKPANNRPEVVSSMLRGSIVGGMTLFSINLISAWSCHRWAERLKRGDAFVGGDLRVAHSVQCLQGFCYYDNLLWAALACVTAVLGSAASVWQSSALARIYFLIFLARGVHCAGSLVWAFSDLNSCSFWALSKAYWQPLITFVHVTVFCTLSWKFCRLLASPEESSLGTPLGLLSVEDWELDSDLDTSHGADDTRLEASSRALSSAPGGASARRNGGKQRGAGDLSI